MIEENRRRERHIDPQPQPSAPVEQQIKSSCRLPWPPWLLGGLLAGDLGGEPGHDVQRRLDELHRRLQQQRHAQAARADARDGQPAITAGERVLDLICCGA